MAALPKWDTNKISVAITVALVAGVAAGIMVAVVNRIWISPPPAAPIVTVDHLVAPFGPRGQLASPYRATQVLVGATCGPTNYTSDPFAHRCYRKESVYDPCWNSYTQQEVACLSAPWLPDTILIRGYHLTSTSTPKASPGVRPQWGLEIQDPVGSHHRLYCIFEGGAQPLIGGLRENWTCRASTSLTAPIAGTAAGEVTQIPGGAWTVAYQAVNSSSTDTATITDIWP